MAAHHYTLQVNEENVIKCHEISLGCHGILMAVEDVEQTHQRVMTVGNLKDHMFLCIMYEP